MKKEFLPLILILVLIIALLAGCGSGIDYTVYTFANVAYDVPSSWTFQKDIDYVYHFPETGLLMVSRAIAGEDVSALTPDEIKERIQYFANGMTSSFMDYEKIDSQSTTVASDLLAEELSFYMTVEGELLESKATIFMHEDSVYVFCFGKPDKISKSDLKIYHHIIDSIVVADL